MPLTHEQIRQITEAGDAFLEKRRPSEEMRTELDLAYRIDGQSVLVYEIRPTWDKPSEIRESPVAKTSFVSNKNHWKVSWIRGDLKWYPYTPKPIVKTINDFFDLVNHDTHACFFG